MAVLHLVGGSIADSRILEQCLSRAGVGEAVLLIADAVYAALDGPLSEEIRRAAGRVAIHVLVPDLEARGFEPTGLVPGIRPIDDRGFVELTLTHTPIVSWW